MTGVETPQIPPTRHHIAIETGKLLASPAHFDDRVNCEVYAELLVDWIMRILIKYG